MKYSIGDLIKIKDPVPTAGGKWGKSGNRGVVKEVFPIKTVVPDIFLIERRLEYHYDLELWHEFAPDRKEMEYSVPESIIEPRD